MKKIFSIILTVAMVASIMSVSFAVKADEVIQISNADELVAFLTNTDNANMDAVLTADIDLSEKGGTNVWKPMQSYSGTFDGAGYTISGLTATREPKNNASEMINESECQDPTDVELGCMGKYSYGFFFVNLSGTVKDLTLKDISASFVGTYNKNYRIDVAALAGYAYGATIDGVAFENVDVTVSANTNSNQGQIGYAALAAARANGALAFDGVTADADCLVDTTACGGFDSAELLGVYEGSDSVTFTACESDAVVNVCTGAWTYAAVGYNGERVTCDGVAGELYKKSSVEVTVTEGQAEIEPSLDGDYYVADWDGNVQYTLNFDNGTLIIVDKVEEDGVDVNGTYTYTGTFETGITVYDASGEATTITISQMRGVPTFNATNMGFGSVMTAGQPPVTPELVLGNNAIATKVENYYAAPVKATFTAAKAGKYTLTAAAGEENAFVAIDVENGSETAELPYEFELEAGETVTFYISTSANVMQNNGNFEDEINLVLSLEGENAETGDLGVMIAVVALVAVLGMGITAVTSKRVSVR